MIWRIWFNGSDSLVEIETKWSIDDIVKANILLNYKAQVQDELEYKEKMSINNGNS